MANAKNAAKNEACCHDCQKILTIDEKEIKNGCLCIYQHEGKKIQVFKCRDCFNKNPSLTNFQDCEVYSRVVGYLRPTKQWNKGKKEEYRNRKVFCCN